MVGEKMNWNNQPFLEAKFWVICAAPLRIEAEVDDRWEWLTVNLEAQLSQLTA